MAIKRNKKQVYNTIIALRNETLQATNGDAVYVKELKKTFNWVSGNTETDDSKYIINQTSESANGRWVAYEALKEDLVLKEDLTNKKTTMTGNEASNVFYLTAKAVYDWAVALFQPLLVSGTNIKTINSTSILGSGNIVIGTVSGTANRIARFLNSSTLTDSLIFDNGTNIGAFTAAPASKFHIKNGESSEVILSDVATTATNRFRFAVKTNVQNVINTKVYEIGMYNGPVNSAHIEFRRGGNSENGSMFFYTDNVVKFYISPADIGSHTYINPTVGNVMIGAGTPTEKAHVQGNLRVTGTHRDSSNLAGTSGQVLSSTGTGTSWITANRLEGYTVATLPTPTVGMTAYVTDALAPTYLAIIVGGGAVVCPVFYNGTNWVAR